MISNHYDYVAKHQPPPALHRQRRQEHSLAKKMLFTWLRDRGCKPRSVLDLACGRGGDLLKVAAAFETCVTYVGADVSEASVKELQRRACEMSMQDAVTTFVCDACNVPVMPRSFDLAIMNFALHYFADDAKHMEALLDKVASVLTPGGVFAGVCVDWRQLRASAHPGFILAPGATNDLHVRPWGRKYRFCLPGCVDADEYIVHWPSVVAMAHSRGLHLVRFRGFNGFLYSMGHTPTCPLENAPYAVFAFIRQTV